MKGAICSNEKEPSEEKKPGDKRIEQILMKLK